MLGERGESITEEYCLEVKYLESAPVCHESKRSVHPYRSFLPDDPMRFTILKLSTDT